MSTAENMRSLLREFFGDRVPELLEDAAAQEPDVRGARARIAEENELERHKRLRPLLIEQGVPPKDIERVLANSLESTEPLEHARKAYGERLAIVVLAGLADIGKTTAAAWWIMRNWPEIEGARRSVRVVKAAALSRWPRLDEERVAQIFEARALVIDDMGVENLSEAGASWFDEVIDIRYDRRAPTLITTNLPLEDFARQGQRVAGFRSRYGARIAGRIRECGGFFECKGPSMRGVR